MLNFKQFLIEKYIGPLKDIVELLNLESKDDNFRFIALAKEYSNYKTQDDYLINIFIQEYVDVLDIATPEEIEEYKNAESEDERDEIENDIYMWASDNMIYHRYSTVSDDLLLLYGKWIDDIVNEEQEEYIPWSDYPAYRHMEYRELLKDKWFIHFSERHAIEDISKNGFTQGVSLDSKVRLAYTRNNSDYVDDSSFDSYDGFIFAYELSYFESSTLFKNESETDFVIFKADAVSIFHYGDQETQAICLVSTIENIFPVYFDDDRYVIYDNYDEEIAYDTETNELDVAPGKIYNDVINNFNDFSQKIVTKY